MAEGTVLRVKLNDMLSIDQQRRIRTHIGSLEGVFNTRADSTATDSAIRASLYAGAPVMEIREEISRIKGVINVRNAL